MTTARFVVLGLGHARAGWFPDVARWSTTGHLPLDFVKCVSVEDLRARAASGRRFSAALVDARVPAVDRDLIGGLHDATIPTLVVESASDRLDWLALGAAACLRTPLTREDLQHALDEHASPVAEVAHDLDGGTSDPPDPRAQGRLVTVTGSAGSGRSTIAAAVAQHLAERRPTGEILLLDLARRAHQALLHDAGDLVPGIQELVEACRNASIAPQDLRPFTFTIGHRGYHLVVGLRRPHDWVAVRARAFAMALESCRRGFALVVADVDDDVEGEAQTGSFDIEDRNLMTRTALSEADVTLVAAIPTLTGLRDLINALQTLEGFGVSGERTLVVVNRAPRSARARADLTRTIADLATTERRTPGYAGVTFLPERRNLDLLHHDQARFPSALTTPVGHAVEVMLERVGHLNRAESDREPVLVQPGSVGTWPEEDR